LIILLPIIAAILFGSQFVFQKLLGQVNTDSYNLSMVLGTVLSTVVIFVFGSLIQGFEAIDLIPFFIAFVGGLFWSFANKLSLVGINNIGMSKTSVILNMVSVISFIFGILFFAETPDLYRYVGIPFLIGGAVLVSLLGENNGGKINKKGVISVFIATIFISINNLFLVDAITAKYVPHLTITFFTSVMCVTLGAIVGAVLLNLKPSKLREWKSQPKRTHLYAMAAGLTWVSGYEISAFILSGPEAGLTYVPLIQSLVTIASALWGIIYFKEIFGKRKLTLYVVGSGIVILGVVIFSL